MTVAVDGVTVYTREKRGYATDLVPNAFNYTTQYQTSYANAAGKRFLTVMTDNADSETEGYGECTLTHDSDGTKSITLSWEADCSFTTSLQQITGSATITLPAIDRSAPTVTLQTSNVTSTGVTLTVLSSAVADRWEYKLDDGSWVRFSSNEASSASVIIDTLSPNTGYSVQVRARRKSNHVYGSSSIETVTTSGGSVIAWAGQVVLNSPYPKIQLTLMIYNTTYTHTLSVSKDGSELFSFTGLTGIVGSNTKILALTTEQAQGIMDVMPTAAQSTLTYTLITYNSNGETVGTYETSAVALITEDAAPTIGGFTVRDTNDDVRAVTGSSDVLVQGLSALRIQVTGATPEHGTALAKYSATIGNITVETDTRNISFGAVDTSGTVTVTITVTDGRGFTAVKTGTIDVIPYRNIVLDSWSIGRLNNVDALVKAVFTGRFSSIMVDGDEKNILLSASYRYKQASSSTYSDSTSIVDEVEVNGNTFSYDNALVSMDMNYAYHVELTVGDAFTSSSVVVYVEKGKPLVALRSGKVGINNNKPQVTLDVLGTIAMNGFTVQGFVSTLDEWTSLDSVIGSGIYAQPQNSNASTDLMYPVEKAGILEVMGEPSGHVVQRYITYDLSGLYVRYRFLGVWSNWKSISLGGDVSLTPDIPDYVKIAALAVAKKVAAKQAELANQITFVAMSDNHYAGEQEDGWREYSNISTEHASMAARILANNLSVDFVCHLGDSTFGNANTTTDLLKAQIRKVLNHLTSSFGEVPRFCTVGNHDTGEYGTLIGAEYLYQAIGSKCDGATFGSTTYGYCYRDFADKKVRVICLNTSEGETDGGSSASYVVSPAQRLWFAQTLYDVGSKTDAAEWGIIVLGHYSLDFGGAYPLSNIVYAYVNGNSITENGTTVNFSGNNAASFIADFHGHTHCFKADSLYRVYWDDSANANVGEAYDAKRVCVPNVSYYRNNYYGDASFFGFTYSDDTTYEKTINSGKDTAFVVNVVDLDNKIIHSFCYGAGVDRVISYGSKVYHSINNTLTHVATDNDATSIEDGAAYSATLTADTGYTLDSVTVTMGGTDITSTAYSDGGVSIASVTGNIVITATASKVVNYTNQVPISTDEDGNIYNGTGYKDGYRINSSGTEAALSGFAATGFIPFTKGQTIRIGGESITYAEYGCMVMFYDTTKTYLSNSGIAYDKVGNTAYGTWTTEENSVFCLDPIDTYPGVLSGNSGYIRVSAKGNGANLIITLDEPID